MTTHQAAGDQFLAAAQQACREGAALPAELLQTGRAVTTVQRAAVSEVPMSQPIPTSLVWHTDASFGDPDDDYTAALIKALADAGIVDLLGVLVNRQPAAARARQLGSTLAALGLTRGGQPPLIGIGADTIGRPMGELHPGAPQACAPAPVDGLALQRRVLADAPDHSVLLLVTTALTDVDRLLGDASDLARRKLRAIVVMGDAMRSEPGSGPCNQVWVPGDATNNRVDQSAAARVFRQLQTRPWRHVGLIVVSRWAVFGGGELTPAVLDELAEAHPVARWLRSRAAASLDQRWTDFCRGSVAGRSRASFVANHLGGCDPDRTADQPIFDLVTGVPVYDAVAAVTALEQKWFEPVTDPHAPNVAVIGVDQVLTGVPDPTALNARLTTLLRAGFGL